jgi:hypothetical protein
MFPCLFHFLTPVNIIQYHDGKIINFGKYGLKILDGWPVTMIAVNKKEMV